jgi:hypothetical protein
MIYKLLFLCVSTLSSKAVQVQMLVKTGRLQYKSGS